MSRRVEHLLVALGICLPVPVFAATGLSVPLPTTVERLAAALVPWANSSSATEPEPLAGEIVRAPGEKQVGVDAEQVAAPGNVRSGNTQLEATDGAKRTKDGSHEKGDDAATSDADAPGDSATTSASGGSGDAGGSGGSGGTTGGSASGSGGSGPDLGAPVQGVVDTVGETTEPVLEGVGGTVGDVGGTLDDVLQGTNNTLAGALSGNK